MGKTDMFQINLQTLPGATPRQQILLRNQEKYLTIHDSDELKVYGTSYKEQFGWRFSNCCFK